MGRAGGGGSGAAGVPAIGGVGGVVGVAVAAGWAGVGAREGPRRALRAPSRGYAYFARAVEHEPIRLRT